MYTKTNYKNSTFIAVTKEHIPVISSIPSYILSSDTSVTTINISYRKQEVHKQVVVWLSVDNPIGSIFQLQKEHIGGDNQRK